MPVREQYGAQPPIELLRQWMDHKGWYEFYTDRLPFRIIDKISFVGAMGPPGGGLNPVTKRFTRHFNFISFPEMEDENVQKIFGTILGAFLKSNFSEEVSKMTEKFVSGSIEVYNKIRVEMLPTPSKSHYTFNLRDLAKIFQGMLDADPKSCNDRQSILRLWAHECNRVFSDRLVNDKDRKQFHNILTGVMEAQFELNSWTDMIDPHSRLLFGDYMSGSSDHKNYEEIKDEVELVKVMNEQLEYYNTTMDRQMNLVMFMDAIEHVSRISRILRQPGGNALLLGVGGSGRQSLTRLAAFMADYKVFQIEISKSFGMKEWKEFLKQMMLTAGVQDEPIVFLFTDTQILYPSFLEDINNLLNAGDVPNLMEQQELDQIYEVMRAICAREGLAVTPISMYSRFIKRVRHNLHIVLAMSPMGEVFRSRLRMVSLSRMDSFGNDCNFL